MGFTIVKSVLRHSVRREPQACLRAISREPTRQRRVNRLCIQAIAYTEEGCVKRH